MKMAYLDQKLKAVCPIDGLNSDGVIHFRDEATEDQRAAATQLLAQLLASDVEATLQGIADLESSITPRRFREAVIGDGGWLASVSQQIDALRAKL